MEEIQATSKKQDLCQYLAFICINKKFRLILLSKSPEIFSFDCDNELGLICVLYLSGNLPGGLRMESGLLWTGSIYDIGLFGSDRTTPRAWIALRTLDFFSF